MRIVIDEVPGSLNRYLGRKNEWEYRQQKEYWKGLVSLAVNLSRDRPEKPYERAAVTLNYYFADKRRRDPDNYCGKMILDGLTAAGVISDDSFERIDLTLRGNVDRKRPRVEIEVEEIWS